MTGVILPVTTPFNSAGDLDESAYISNLATWLRAPIRGFVVSGSTGEAPFLARAELLRLVELARAEVDEGLVIAGTGAESTRQTIQLTKGAAARGADAVLVRPPSYYKGAMTGEALRDHFLALADAAPVPVILYHMPKYVPVELLPELVGELVKHDNVIGIKDSSGDLKNLGALTDACDARAGVLVGNGSYLYSALEIGATGGVVAVGLLVAELACECYEAFHAGRTFQAGKLQERIGPLNKVVVGKHGVPGVKQALDLLGLKGGPPRAPLRPVKEKARDEIRTALKRAGVLEGRDPLV